jgi:hypothetical protein
LGLEWGFIFGRVKRLEGKREKLEKKEKEGKRQRRDAEFAEERR